MVTLTARDVVLLAVMGGAACALCLVLLIAAGFGIAAACSHLRDRLEPRRARRSDLKACRAINALGTTNHSKD
ncbi:hypothetical protein ACFYRN_25155 [Streptomyces sp. NPDC005227]|uniref:hypothetical protein n=1 Tax=Streptomyces sp. NPDC005227 TaxID=3364707 RepID=UPI0036BCDC19